MDFAKKSLEEPKLKVKVIFALFLCILTKIV